MSRYWRSASNRLREGRLLGVLIAIAALASLAGIGYARSGDAGSGTINGCVKKRGGWLRIVDANARCRRGERAIAFNEQGPQGPHGARGPKGQRGDRGQTGQPGAAGSPGPAGDAVFTVVGGGSCADIQAAIDALPAAGGAVLIKAGTYICGGSIVIDRNSVTLRGTGPATVLKLGNQVNRPVLVLGQTAANPTTTRRGIRVADLSIDGNRLQQSFECSNGPCSGGNFLRNNGISLRRVEDALVENVSVSGARSGGLVAEMGSRRLTVRDFTASDSQFDGLAGYNTEDSLFTGLNLHDNVAAGLSFDTDFDHNTISDSVLANNGDVGVFMRHASDNLFSGVRIRDSFKDGIFLAENDQTNEPAAGNTFTGMVISGSGDAGAPANEGYGIKVADASCTDNLVVASQFVGNRDGDVFEAVPSLLMKEATITR
jgi:parallel beta helix pectate lyase-like protein/collagen triple helix repeat protein